MNKSMRHFFLAIFFSILSVVGLWFIEWLEGSKITTSEYLDLGFFMIGFGGILAFPFYFVSFFVLHVLFDQLLPNYFYPKLIGFATLGGICGYWIFRLSYGERFIREYGLNIETSIITFIFVGLLLVCIDKYIQNVKG